MKCINFSESFNQCHHHIFNISTIKETFLAFLHEFIILKLSEKQQQKSKHWWIWYTHLEIYFLNLLWLTYLLLYIYDSCNFEMSNFIVICNLLLKKQNWVKYEKQSRHSLFSINRGNRVCSCAFILRLNTDSDRNPLDRICIRNG